MGKLDNFYSSFSFKKRNQYKTANFFRRLSKKNLLTYLKVSTYLWINEKSNTNVNLIATSIALKKTKKTKQIKFTWTFRIPLKNEGIISFPFLCSESKTDSGAYTIWSNILVFPLSYLVDIISNNEG